jgi:hypothetical protein
MIFFVFLEDDYQEPIPTTLVTTATAESAPMFGKIRAPLKLRMPKKRIPKVVLATVAEVDENIVEEVVPVVVRYGDDAFFTFRGYLFILCRYCWSLLVLQL